MLKFQFEKINGLLLSGLEDMAFSNWEEVEVDTDIIPLAPDWDHYRALEKIGTYRCISARFDDQLVGYNSFFVNRHSRSRDTVMAVSDVLYLIPEMRRGWTGVNFIRESEKMLREAGVVRVQYGITFRVELGARRKTLGDLLVDLGYRHIQSSYVKVL